MNIENKNYEGSGIVKEKKDANGKMVERVKRGYKLGSLLDDGGIITSIAFGAIQVHDLNF